MRKTPSGLVGLLVVDKPAGPTSHDVVARLRQASGESRVGHAGTLDPPATGVLVCAFGWATRLLRFVTGVTKTYTATIAFGAATTTLDAAGEIVAEADASTLQESDVLTAAAAFVGEYQQVPPMVSAVKIGGRRLHELARAGVDVERAPRTVSIEQVRVVAFRAGARAEADVEVRCGTGTYIRSLAADIGSHLGLPAHARVLRRTAIGGFHVADARVLEDVEHAGRAGTLAGMLLPPAAAMRDGSTVTADGEILRSVRHGRRLPAGTLLHDAGTAAVLDPAGALVAVYTRAGDEERAEVVAPTDT